MPPLGLELIPKSPKPPPPPPELLPMPPLDLELETVVAEAGEEEEGTTTGLVLNTGGGGDDEDGTSPIIAANGSSDVEVDKDDALGVGEVEVPKPLLKLPFVFPLLPILLPFELILVDDELGVSLTAAAVPTLERLLDEELMAPNVLKLLDL
jgi:hypothetical protein